MNKESSIKQLKRIKQEMTHADDVNALDFAIRFMGNKTLDKIRAEIEQTIRDCDEYNDYGRMYGLQIALDIIDKYKAEDEG